MTHKVTICGFDTAQLPRLKAKECDELIAKIKGGDTEAEDYFIKCNLRLVLSVVQRFSSRGSSDDLFQVGCVGLMKAIKNFDVGYNVRFSTYAVPMIIGEIRRFLRDETSIKVSRRIRDVAYKALKTKETMEREQQRIPCVMEIAAELDIPVKEISCALDAVSEPISIYETAYSDSDDSLMLMEQLFDAKENEENWLENVTLKSALKTLPLKEREVLELRYYIGKTQTEISSQIGISQAQVSRLEKNALTKLAKLM